MRKASSLFIIIILVFIINTVSSGDDAYNIMLKSYSLDKGKDFIKKMTMTLINNVGKKRVRELTIWRLEQGDNDKSILKFRKPVSIRGIGFLLWEHKDRDDDQWLYLPSYKKIRRIAAAEKEKTFLGTDFSYSDLSYHHPDEYEHRILGEEIVDGFKCYKVENRHRTHTNDPVYKNKKKYMYSKGITWIRKDNYVLVKANMFDKKGREFKELHARDIKKINGIWTSHVIEMKNLKENHKTILTITNIKYNVGLKEDFFCHRQLKRVQ